MCETCHGQRVVDVPVWADEAVPAVDLETVDFDAHSGLRVETIACPDCEVVASPGAGDGTSEVAGV